MTPENILHRLFTVAVAAADPMKIVPEALPERPKGRVLVIGAGKASARMAEAVEAAWGPCEGLVITRYGYARPCQGIEIAEAAHPVPDDAGLCATRRMLDLLSGLGPDDTVLALISGGGSALLTAPAGHITLAEMQDLNTGLLASGAPIDRMNLVRKHLSRVAGGQLAAAAAPARMLTLLISDVPGDDPALIASGPTVGDFSTSDEARAILDHYGLTLPPSIRDVLTRGSAVRRPDNPVFANHETRIIAAPSQSLAAAAAEAERLGGKAIILGDALEGEARDLAKSQVALARNARAKAHPDHPWAVLLSGGECTVTRRGAGVGGPNAEFALAAAITLQGADGISLMACDTDGVDGAAEVAGALVLPDTLTRAETAGVDPRHALEQNDSHGFFRAIDRQVVTGPTLTNVNDFRAFLIHPEGTI